MANTFTNLMPHAYAALHRVSRENAGYVRAINADAQISAAALNEEIRVPVVQAATVRNITRGMNFPADADSAVTTTAVKLTKSRKAAFQYSGEEQLRRGAGLPPIVQQNFQEAFRVLVSEIESDIGAEFVKAGAGRAIGTAGTTPFASNHDPLIDALQILTEQGAPLSMLRCVPTPAAFANLLKLGNLIKVNEAGTSETLRDAAPYRLANFDLFPTATTIRHDQAAGVTGYTINGAEAKGQTTLTVDSGGSNLAAGDVISASGHSASYVVQDGITGAAGDIKIAKPGLVAALANNTALTFGGDYAATALFHPSAMAFGMRLPACPEGGDIATDRRLMQDPSSDMVFEVRTIPGNRINQITVAAVWGVKAIQPERGVLLMG